ncbi:MAG: SIMPL domain-containing protein [Patescibacteria group bacterium]
MNDNSQVKNSAIAGFLGVLTLIVIYSVVWGPARKYMDSLYPSRTINVSAEGKVTVSPDVAKFSFSVVNEGSDPAKIANDNNVKINKAIDFIKSQGIDAKDIKTISYSLDPNYVYDEKTRRQYLSGYKLTQSVQVKVRDLNKVAVVLAGLPELGINQIGSISFEVDDQEKFLKEARDKAFDKVKTKAQEMTGKNGVSLGRIINLSEYQNGPIPYYGAEKSIGMGGGVASVAPSIQPGTQEITVNVNITYEIK